VHNVRNVLKKVIDRDIETCMQWNKGLYSMYMFIIGGVKQKKICQRAKRHIQCVYVLRWKSIRKKIANGLIITDGLMQMRIRIQITV